MATVEITRKNQAGEIKIGGAVQAAVPTIDTNTTGFNLPGRHGILSLPEGDLSIKVDLRSNPPRVVFAGTALRRTVIPMPQRGDREDQVAQVALNPDTLVTVRAPEALGVQLKRRRRAYEALQRWRRQPQGRQPVLIHGQAL